MELIVCLEIVGLYKRKAIIQSTVIASQDITETSPIDWLPYLSVGFEWLRELRMKNKDDRLKRVFNINFADHDHKMQGHRLCLHSRHAMLCEVRSYIASRNVRNQEDLEV